jgi:hypothetical protein
VPIGPLFLDPKNRMTPPEPVDTAYYSATYNGSLAAGPGGAVELVPGLPDTDGDGAAEFFASWAGAGASPLASLGVDVGPALSGTGFFNGFAQTEIVEIQPDWTFLQAALGFTLSGGGDHTFMRGVTAIVPAVPEPTVAALLGAALFALRSFRRSVRRRAAQPNRC